MADTSFVFTLPQKRLRSYNTIASLMLLFAIVQFAMVMYHYPQTPVLIVYGVLVAFIAGYWFYTAQILAATKPQYYLRIAFFAAAAGWLYPNTGNIFLAILYIISGLLEQKAKNQQYVTVSSKNISITGFPEKHIYWSDLANVVLKDNLLTIDYKNNKLFQSEVTIITANLQESVFNHFCREHLDRQS